MIASEINKQEIETGQENCMYDGCKNKTNRYLSNWEGNFWLCDKHEKKWNREHPKDKLKVVFVHVYCLPKHKVFDSKESNYKLLSALVWNVKTSEYSREIITEYIGKCPMCDNSMVVRAVYGSSYLACCSEKCYKEYDKKYRKGRR